MKNVHYYSMTFIYMFFCLIACGPANKLSRAHSIPQAIINPSFSEPPVYYPKQDTPVKRIIPDTAKIRKALIKPVQSLIDAPRIVPYDTMVKMNAEWQRFSLRLIDSNLKRRVQVANAVKGKDSALIVGKELLKRVSALQDKQGVSQQVGGGMIKFSETIANWIIFYIAIIGTLHLILTQVHNRRKKINI